MAPLRLDFACKLFYSFCPFVSVFFTEQHVLRVHLCCTLYQGSVLSPGMVLYCIEDHSLCIHSLADGFYAFLMLQNAFSLAGSASMTMTSFQTCQLLGNG